MHQSDDEINENDEAAAKKRGPKSAIERLTPLLECWKTPDGEFYADFTLQGKRRHVQIMRSPYFQGVCTQLLGGNPLTVKLFLDVVGHFESIAAESGVVRPVFLRLAQDEGAIYYDMSDQAGTKVRFKDGRWHLVRDGGPRFVQGAGQKAQVLPHSGLGKLPDLLKPFVTVKTEKDLALVVSWLIGCFKPGGPYPVLIITGEQGSAKSTTTKVLRRLVDPHTRHMRMPPSDMRDFGVALKHGYMVAFDNVSQIDNKFSDTLCCLAYGDMPVGGRALYSNFGDVSFMAARPLVLNGITDFVLRPDLLERSICIHLPPIEKKDRQDDDTFWAKFDKALPGILGALYDAVACAQLNFKHTDVPENMRVRMSNFARWAAAAEPALNFPKGFVLSALSEAAEETVARATEHDAVSMAIYELMQETPIFHGDLHVLANNLVQYRRLEGYWPETPLQLSNQLKRIKPALRKLGIEAYENGRDTKTRRVQWELRNVMHKSNNMELPLQ
jgi:putative DNA primase/helicase